MFGLEAKELVPDAITIIVLVITCVYSLGRAREKDENAHASMTADIKEIKDNYVGREDFNRHETSIKELYDKSENHILDFHTKGKS